MKFLFPFILLILAHPARADRARNIFDDDWTPPKTAPAQHPAPAKPPTPTPNDPPPNLTTNPPIPTPKDPTPAPAIAQPTRLPIPTPAAQAAVRKLMKELFAAQLADRTIPARRKLTAALLAQVEKSKDAPTDQFVLLAAVIDSAIESADLSAAFRAADKMSESFDVDPIALKIDAALKLGPKSSVPDKAAENVSAAIDLADQLAQAEEFITAVKICTAIQPATTASPALRTQMQQHLRDFTAAREAADNYSRDLAKLKDSPNDPAANLSVGRYLCFVKNDWPAGLPMLAKSADPLLKSRADFELTHPTTTEEITHVADTWWVAAEKQTDTLSKIAITSHAAAIYSSVIDQLAGLRKLQILQRIEEAAKTAATTANGIDLLKLVGKRFKPDKNYWSISPTGLKCVKHGVALLPYAPPEEYDLHVTFERLESTGDSIGIISPLPHGTVTWIAGGWGNVVFGFGTHHGGWGTVTKRELPADTIRKNVRYTCLIKVRKTQATAALDGKLLSEFASDGTGCKVDDAQFNGKSVLGFAVNTPVEFSEVTLTEITGLGHIVTDQK